MDLRCEKHANVINFNRECVPCLVEQVEEFERLEKNVKHLLEILDKPYSFGRIDKSLTIDMISSSIKKLEKMRA